MASIQQHLVMIWFTEFFEDNDFNNTSDLVKYIETLELEQIPSDQVNNKGTIECEAYRPYVIILDPTKQDSTMYWGVQIPMIPSADWAVIHKLFKDYANHNLEYLKALDSMRDDKDIAYPIEPIPFSGYLNEDYPNAEMIYFIMNGGEIGAKRMAAQSCEHYTLRIGQACWGDIPNASVYYIDEILKLKPYGMLRYSINWSDNPLEKYIRLHKENLRLEKERIALLEKMERIEELTEKNKAYISRKQRKYLKNRLDVINDKVETGLYFDYNRLSILYDKLSNIQGSQTSGNHTRLKNLIDVAYGSMNEINHNTVMYRDMFRCIVDLFPDYDIITTEKFNRRYQGKKRGFETSFANYSQYDWLQELYMSGIDLSYYTINDKELKAMQGISLATETTICLDLGKKGGPLSKSIYYRSIDNMRPGPPWIMHLPRWAFIDKRG